MEIKIEIEWKWNRKQMENKIEGEKYSLRLIREKKMKSLRNNRKSLQ